MCPKYDRHNILSSSQPYTAGGAVCSGLHTHTSPEMEHRVLQMQGNTLVPASITSITPRRCSSHDGAQGCIAVRTPLLLKSDMCAFICTANPGKRKWTSLILNRAHRHADVGAAVQEQRLRAPIAQPGSVQVYQQRHQQRTSGRAVGVVAVPGVRIARSALDLTPYVHS